jgi:hypothetical protein
LIELELLLGEELPKHDGVRFCEGRAGMMGIIPGELFKIMNRFVMLQAIEIVRTFMGRVEILGIS